MQVGAAISEFAALVAGNTPLHDALTNPVIPAAAKQRVVTELIARLGLTPPVSKLLLMLAERDRLTLLADVVEIYRTRLEEHQGVVRAEVTAASALSPEQTRALQDRLASALGRSVTMTTRIDTALIGGVVARIGGTVYDGSVATRLTKMREKLLQDI